MPTSETCPPKSEDKSSAWRVFRLGLVSNFYFYTNHNPCLSCLDFWKSSQLDSLKNKRCGGKFYSLQTGWEKFLLVHVWMKGKEPVSNHTVGNIQIYLNANYLLSKHSEAFWTNKKWTLLHEICLTFLVVTMWQFFGDFKVLQLKNKKKTWKFNVVKISCNNVWFLNHYFVDFGSSYKTFSAMIVIIIHIKICLLKKVWSDDRVSIYLMYMNILYKIKWQNYTCLFVLFIFEPLLTWLPYWNSSCYPWQSAKKGKSKFVCPWPFWN